MSALVIPTDKSADLERLAFAAQNGDDAAFARLAAELLPSVRRRASRLSTPYLDADDLTQEGMLGLLSAVHTYRSEAAASFLTYAGICVQNRMLSALRRAAGGKSVHIASTVPLTDCELPDSSLSLEERQDLREECARLLSLVETRLSDTERTVLKLFLSGRTYREIAEVLGIAPKSVDNALQRVRQKLKG